MVGFFPICWADLESFLRTSVKRFADMDGMDSWSLRRISRSASFIS